MISTAKVFVGDDVSKATLDVSGKKSGTRFIGGGRGQVRRVLYIAMIVAICHNPVIKAFYVHLKSKGKES